MEPEYASLSSDALIEMYHKINSELTKQFLNRVPWEEQQERINNLSKISRELAKRSIEPKHESEGSDTNETQTNY
jgi:hypothetical protein